MKHLFQFIAITTCSLMSMGGCAFVEQQFTPTKIRYLTFSAGKRVFDRMGDRRCEKAKYFFSAARAIRMFEGDHIPSPAELEAAVKQFTPKTSEWTDLAELVASVIADAKPYMGDNSKKNFDRLEGMAAGLDDLGLLCSPIPLFSPIPSKSPIIGGNPPPGSRPSPKPSLSDPVPTSGPDFSAPPTA